MAWHKFQPIVPSFKRELTAKIVFIDNLEIDKLIGTIFKKQKNPTFSLVSRHHPQFPPPSHVAIGHSDGKVQINIIEKSYLCWFDFCVWK
jgi:hypothetical protein